MRQSISPQVTRTVRQDHGPRLRDPTNRGPTFELSEMTALVPSTPRNGPIPCRPVHYRVRQYYGAVS